MTLTVSVTINRIPNVNRNYLYLDSKLFNRLQCDLRTTSEIPVIEIFIRNDVDTKAYRMAIWKKKLKFYVKHYHHADRDLLKGISKMSCQCRAVVLREPLHRGVSKAFVKKLIRIDVVAGTPVGAVNAAIIVGSKSDHPEEALKNLGWN